MAQRISLREYQQKLSERLKTAEASDAAGSRLGIEAGDELWLLDLADAGDVVTLPQLERVPLTRPWFAGTEVPFTPNPAVPTPVTPSASSSSTTTSQVRAGVSPADDAPRSSTTPPSVVMGVPHGRPIPFAAGAALGATVERRRCVTCAVIVGAPTGRPRVSGA